MAAPAPPRIFLSYAHRDAAELAQRLHDDLTAASFEVWLDSRALHAADTWTLEIEQAIDHSQVGPEDRPRPAHAGRPLC